MPDNYVLLERIELNASAASITFSNIPQTGYTDLKVVASVRGTDSTIYTAMNIAFNGSSTGFTGRIIEGAGSGTPVSGTPTTGIGDPNGNTSTASTYGNVEIYIPNYTSSNFKSFSTDGVGENNATTAYAYLVASLWSNTAAINSVTLSPTSGQSWMQYSTFSLYGLAAVGTTPTIAPKASGGNIIETDGTYWYHAFLSTGAFVPAVGLTCDILQVAGGGSGGSYSGGGAGAGGVLAFSSQSVASLSSNTVTVGAGGAAVTGNLLNGNNGTNSQFASLTASVGGGYGSAGNGGPGGIGTTGGTGGSGGGAGGNSATAGSGGSATSGQGNAGGGTTANGGGGGGGGAGAAGTAGSGGAGSETAGPGGAGISTLSPFGSFSSMFTLLGIGVSGFIAGGGGGGGDANTAAGGSGGGGTGTRGVNSSLAGNGTANTGSGGGGTYYSTGTWAGAGGSGIVIVRYLAA